MPKVSSISVESPGPQISRDRVVLRGIWGPKMILANDSQPLNFRKRKKTIIEVLNGSCSKYERFAVVVRFKVNGLNPGVFIFFFLHFYSHPDDLFLITEKKFFPIHEMRHESF